MITTNCRATVKGSNSTDEPDDAALVFFMLNVVIILTPRMLKATKDGKYLWLRFLRSVIWFAEHWDNITDFVHGKGGGGVINVSVTGQHTVIQLNMRCVASVTVVLYVLLKSRQCNQVTYILNFHVVSRTIQHNML